MYCFLASSQGNPWKLRHMDDAAIICPRGVLTGVKGSLTKSAATADSVIEERN
jgi:hypothetical protein